MTRCRSDVVADLLADAGGECRRRPGRAGRRLRPFAAVGRPRVAGRVDRDVGGAPTTSVTQESGERFPPNTLLSAFAMFFNTFFTA